MNEEKSPRAEVGPGQGQIVKILYEDRHRALREAAKAPWGTYRHGDHWRYEQFTDRTGPLVDEVVAELREMALHVDFGVPPPGWRRLIAKLAALDEESAR